MKVPRIAIRTPIIPSLASRDSWDSVPGAKLEHQTVIYALTTKVNTIPSNTRHKFYKATPGIDMFRNLWSRTNTEIDSFLFGSFNEADGLNQLTGIWERQNRTKTCVGFAATDYHLRYFQNTRFSELTADSDWLSHPTLPEIEKCGQTGGRWVLRELLKKEQIHNPMSER